MQTKRSNGFGFRHSLVNLVGQRERKNKWNKKKKKKGAKAGCVSVPCTCSCNIHIFTYRRKQVEKLTNEYVNQSPLLYGWVYKHKRRIEKKRVSESSCSDQYVKTKNLNREQYYCLAYCFKARGANF